MVAAGQLQEAHFARYAPSLTPRNSEAIRIWNLMGGLDWPSLPVVLALEPVADVRGLVDRLVLIRDALRG